MRTIYCVYLISNSQSCPQTVDGTSRGVGVGEPFCQKLNKQHFTVKWKWITFEWLFFFYYLSNGPLKYADPAVIMVNMLLNRDRLEKKKKKTAQQRFHVIGLNYVEDPSANVEK